MADLVEAFRDITGGVEARNRRPLVVVDETTPSFMAFAPIPTARSERISDPNAG